MKRIIKEKESLSDYPQIGLLIFQILNAARAAGMTDAEGEKTYQRLLDLYGDLPGALFWQLRDELIRILVTPDEIFESPSGEGQHFTDRFN